MTKFIDGAGYNHDEISVTDMPNMAVQLDTSMSPVLYVGTAVPGSATSGAVWRIKKVDTTTGVKVTWADGDQNFDNIWDNRLGLSYT